MSASWSERTNDATFASTFQEELKRIEDALNNEFSFTVGSTFISSVEEEEFDRAEIVEDIKDGLTGDEGDSNLLAELNFADNKRRQLCCRLILDILNVKMDTQCHEGGEGEAEEDTASSHD